MKTILQSTILNWTRSKPLRTLLASALILTISATLNCPSAMAQKFDLEAYLKKIDANRNGRMDEAELGGRMKSYVVKLGLDPKKSPSIKKILSVSTKYESKKSESSSKKGESKVPGFGSTVDDVDRTPVGSFGKVEEKKNSGSSTSAAKQSFSKTSMERAEKTLSRYDKNKNGSLDRDEIKSAPWGSPSPSQSDLNKDGRLSKSELAQRYQSREQYYRGSSSRNSSSRSSSSRTSSRSSSSSSSKRIAEDRARREKERSKYKSSYSKTSSSPSSTSRTSSRSSSESKKPDAAVSRAKYEKYVKGLIKGYDTDKDGKLSKDELSKMRRPPTGADSDKDGFVTESELLDSLSGTKKSSSKSTAKTESKTDSKSTAKRSKSSTYERKSSRSGSRYSRFSSSSFESMDQSGDKQVQMHEFSDKWDDEKVAEFYKIDKNGDGVITSKEWSQRER